MAARILGLESEDAAEVIGGVFALSIERCPDDRGGRHQRPTALPMPLNDEAVEENHPWSEPD